MTLWRAGMSQQQQQQQQHQDPVSCFPCGATTPQSPLLSPRMGQGQSPMLQQNQGPPQTQHQGPNQGGPPSYQPSADLNGWPQPANITSSNSVYPQQSQSHYSTQPGGGMYSGNNNMNLAMGNNSMNPMSGQMSSMASMNTEQGNESSLILEQITGIDMLTQEGESSSNFCWPQAAVETSSEGTHAKTLTPIQLSSQRRMKDLMRTLPLCHTRQRRGSIARGQPRHVQTSGLQSQWVLSLLNILCKQKSDITGKLPSEPSWQQMPNVRIIPKTPNCLWFLGFQCNLFLDWYLLINMWYVSICCSQIKHCIHSNQTL